MILELEMRLAIVLDRVRTKMNGLYRDASNVSLPFVGSVRSVDNLDTAEVASYCRTVSRLRISPFEARTIRTVFELD